jgi:hypothetical protein
MGAEHEFERQEIRKIFEENDCPARPRISRRDVTVSVPLHHSGGDRERKLRTLGGFGLGRQSWKEI